MKRRTVLSIILTVLFIFAAVLAPASMSLAAATAKTDLSSYAGDYTLKQGSATVATISVKYEGSKLSVRSIGGKTWYELSLKQGTTSTYTLAKLPGIIIEFLKGGKMKYSQNGLFSIVLTGSKKAGSTPKTTKDTKKDSQVDLKKLAGNYTLTYDGKTVGVLTIKYENNKLVGSTDNTTWCELILTPGTTNTFTSPQAPGYKAVFPKDGKVQYIMPNGGVLEGTKN